MKTNLATARRQTGVTLIELMVAIAILGILAAIAVPGMVNWVRDARLAAQSDLLITSLSSTRLEAIKRRQDVTFCPSSSPHTATACSGSAADWSKGWLIMSGTDVIQRVNVGKGVIITSDLSSPAIQFNGTLGSATSTAVFSVCIEGRKKHQIELSLSGHVGKRITTECS